MFESIEKLEALRLQSICGFLIFAVAALCFLLPLSITLPEPSLSQPLEIRDCGTASAPLPATNKRWITSPTSEPQTCFFAAPILVLEGGQRHQAATINFASPSDPLFQGINRHAKPPPRLC